MCLGIPGKILEIDDNTAVVEFGNVRRNIDTRLIEEPRMGEYVLVQAGFAINKIDEEEALRTLELISELAAQEGAD